MSRRSAPSVARALPRIILVAEDDPEIARFLMQMLRDEGGYLAFGVGDGPAALAVLDRVRVDLVLLDVDLPGLDGLAAYDRLRARPETATTPVVFVTGGRHDAAFARRGVDWLR